MELKSLKLKNEEIYAVHKLSIKNPISKLKYVIEDYLVYQSAADTYFFSHCSDENLTHIKINSNCLFKNLLGRIENASEDIINIFTHLQDVNKQYKSFNVDIISCKNCNKGNFKNYILFFEQFELFFLIDHLEMLAFFKDNDFSILEKIEKNTVNAPLLLSIDKKGVFFVGGQNEN